MLLYPTINDYKTLDRLGKGAYGIVYLVESVDQEKYALKLIQVTKENKKQARLEAEMHIKLDHPNIIKARQFFYHSQERQLAIVLQFCPDGNLSNRIGKITPSQCKQLLKQIAEALLYLHNKKVIHRDIKLQNILMVGDVPKIADLGISKIMMNTGLSTQVGTQFYMAPQIFDQDKYDGKADIWSLGIVILELMTGKRIYEMIKGLKAPAMRQDFPAEILLNELKDQEIKELVRKMLKKKPTDRFSAQDVIDFLKGQLTKKQSGQNNSQSTKKQSGQDNSNSSSVNQLSQKFKNINIEQSIAQPKTQYRFSQQQKAESIKLANNNSKATNPNIKPISNDMALVEGILSKKGSAIRFKIQKIGYFVALGVAIRSLIQPETYECQSNKETGHGCFLIHNDGNSSSHSQEEENNKTCSFRFDAGDVVRVETDEKSLLFVNETRMKQIRMKLKLTQKEWQQACFCAILYCKGDSVSIL